MQPYSEHLSLQPRFSQGEQRRMPALTWEDEKIPEILNSEEEMSFAKTVVDYAHRSVAGAGLINGVAAGGVAATAVISLATGGFPIARQASELWGSGMQHVADALVQFGTAAPIADLMAVGISAITPFAAGGVIGWMAGKGVQAVFKVPAVAKMRAHIDHFFDRNTDSIPRIWAEKNRDVLRGVLTAKGDWTADGKEHFYWIDDKARLTEVSEREYLSFHRQLRYQSAVRVEIKPEQWCLVERQAAGQPDLVLTRPRIEMVGNANLNPDQLASMLNAARAELTQVGQVKGGFAGQNLKAMRTPNDRLAAWRQQLGAADAPVVATAEVAEAFGDEDEDAPGM